jgi:hypothetical protein
MVKKQIKMVKIVLPILPEKGESHSMLLPQNKNNNKINKVKIFCGPINMAQGLYFNRYQEVLKVTNSSQ